MKVIENVTKNIRFSPEDIILIRKILLYRYEKKTIGEIFDEWGLTLGWWMPLFGAMAKVTGTSGENYPQYVHFNFSEKNAFCDLLRDVYHDDDGPFNQEERDSILNMLETIWNI